MSSSHLVCNNFTPTIGVLCIDIAIELQKTYGNEYYSYIEASYVKYLESAGARVIPIWINRPRSYYETIMNKINGILFPGGAVFFDAKDCSEDLRNHCIQASKHIFQIAKDFNENGKYFPLWGTCMGFQLMLTHSANHVDIRQECAPMHCSLPLKFESDEALASSKLFGNLNKDLTIKMSTLPFGIHLHRYCITKDDLRKHQIDNQWKVLACNQDENGLEFITIAEHTRFPFYGSQIHTERVGFHNFMSRNEIHHCLECFQLARYFAEFFVQQCGLNRNRFDNEDEESLHSIYNFLTVLCSEKDVFRQSYLFKSNTDYPRRIKY